VASIESSSYPLVFPVANAAALGFGVAASAGPVIRTTSRALTGMHKEAIVCNSAGAAWRMVSDEGPYLNGTDLAPFPLAFFTAGMAADFMAAMAATLAQRQIAYRDIHFTQDNRYSMTGSALKGTMTGGALPVELRVNIDADVDRNELAELVTTAIDAASVSALLRTRLDSEFSLTVNGRQTTTGRVAPLATAIDGRVDGFDAAAPSPTGGFAPNIIEKLESAATVFGVDGGAGSSLSPEQDRILHVRGICDLRDDGLIDIRTQLLKPIGSVFRFLATSAARDTRAPSGLAYLSAGIGFCYMTQLGRYAHIVKKPLNSYRLVQDTRFGTSGNLAPVRTHVLLDTPEGDNYGRTLVDIGEQTCFLHAVCRSNVVTNIAVNP